jgi:hypothetical protein
MSRQLESGCSHAAAPKQTERRMNPLSAIKKYYYSKTTKTSEQQLKEDFLEYPPSPLRKTKPTWEFDVIKTRGIGNIYNQFDTAMALSRASEAEIDPAAYKEFQLKTLHDAISLLKQWKLLHKFSLVLLCSMLFYSLVRASRRRRIKAVFLPLFKAERKITLKIKRGDTDDSLASILSHEHIHLLQQRSAHAPAQHLDNPADIISDKQKDNPFMQYLFQGLEVEARLHEVVVSYYRCKRQLPLTVDGFIELLAGSEKISEFLILPDEYNEECVDINVNKYLDRDPKLTEQLDITILYVKDELRPRFVSEVLPVMYENLIRYYGDDEAADEFSRQIARPNLYDELYGRRQLV